jgi:hypothetical protein
LVAIPDIAALKLRESHMTAVDVVEDGVDLHMIRLLPVSSSCIMLWLRPATRYFENRLRKEVGDPSASSPLTRQTPTAINRPESGSCEQVNDARINADFHGRNQSARLQYFHDFMQFVS